jgi:hypothetical protein
MVDWRRYVSDPDYARQVWQDDVKALREAEAAKGTKKPDSGIGERQRERTLADDEPDEAERRRRRARSRGLEL